MLSFRSSRWEGSREGLERPDEGRTETAVDLGSNVNKGLGLVAFFKGVRLLNEAVAET